MYLYLINDAKRSIPQAKPLKTGSIEKIFFEIWILFYYLSIPGYLLKFSPKMSTSYVSCSDWIFSYVLNWGNGSCLIRVIISTKAYSAIHLEDLWIGKVNAFDWVFWEIFYLIDFERFSLYSMKNVLSEKIMHPGYYINHPTINVITTILFSPPPHFPPLITLLQGVHLELRKTNYLLHCFIFRLCWTFWYWMVSIDADHF